MPGEREIADLVAEGLGNKQIAARLSLSESTVKKHIEHAFNKTRTEGRVQLARYMWSNARPWNGA